jgi:hypothetical protein
MNPKRSKSRNAGKMPMVHPNAAAIDVGATMHGCREGRSRTGASPQLRYLHGRSASAGRLVY